MQLTGQTNTFDSKTSLGDMMISATQRTPFVKYIASRNALMIRGYSIEVDMHKFYTPIIDRIKSEVERTQKLNIYLDLEDLNPSTAKTFFNFFSFLMNLKSKGGKINVFWKANTPEMAETAMDYAKLTGLDFNMRGLNRAA